MTYYIVEGKNQNAIIYYTEKEAIDSNKKYITVNELPEGSGILKTDSISVWYDNNDDVHVDPITHLQQENKFLKAQLKAQTERSDFIEDCIAEMAGVVYNTEETTM